MCNIDALFLRYCVEQSMEKRYLYLHFILKVYSYIIALYHLQSGVGFNRKDEVFTYIKSTPFLAVAISCPI